jgi:hypothetical protein
MLDGQQRTVSEGFSTIAKLALPMCTWLAPLGYGDNISNTPRFSMPIGSRGSLAFLPYSGNGAGVASGNHFLKNLPASKEISCASTFV